jgi:predicted lipid-binding transport protein (Tim44 family)
MASFMMIALLVVAALSCGACLHGARRATRRKACSTPARLQVRVERTLRMRHPGAGVRISSDSGQQPSAAAAANIPADFDVAGFLRQAKLNFVRLQAANDSGDVEDIRSFTSPEVFAEIRMQLQERGTSEQHTDVVQVDASCWTSAPRATSTWRAFASTVSSAKKSMRRLSRFDEVWHLSKPVSGERGWLISGIQQME